MKVTVLQTFQFYYRFQASHSKPRSEEEAEEEEATYKHVSPRCRAKRPCHGLVEARGLRKHQLLLLLKVRQRFKQVGRKKRGALVVLVEETKPRAKEKKKKRKRESP